MIFLVNVVFLIKRVLQERITEKHVFAVLRDKKKTERQTKKTEREGGGRNGEREVLI